MATWTSGYELNDGDLDGKLVYQHTRFPNAEAIGGLVNPSSINETWYGDEIQVGYWDNDTYTMIPVHSYFQHGAALFSGQLIASIPLYYDQQHTGNFKIYLNHPSDYVYEAEGNVTDPSGQVLAVCSGRAAMNINHGSTQWDGSAINAYFAFSKFPYGNNDCIGFYFNVCQSCLEPYNGRFYAVYSAFGSAINFGALYSAAGITANNTGKPKERSQEFGPASDPGGYGPEDPTPGGPAGGPAPTFNGDSDEWTPTPTKPGVLSFGLLNIYKCDAGALANLGRELFPEITWPASTGFSDIVEWLGNVIEAFSDSIWNKGLIDYIVSIHLIPVNVSAGALEDIKIGPRTMTGILARSISADVIEVDLGSVHVDEFYTNYIDYMTRCKLYLPFYGMIQIKPEYWQSATIQVKYLWNVMDGSFVAQVFSTITRHQKKCQTMIGQYSGNACVHMPLSGANYASMFASIAGGAAGIAAGAASGNVAVAATSAMNLAGAMSGDMQQSNSYNASSAFYGHSRPYLIIERPVSHFSTRYVTEKGLPLIKNKTIGSCSGFTTAEDIILDGIPCTEAEKEKIRALFKSGVIIK